MSSATVDITAWKLAEEALHERARLDRASLAIDALVHSSLRAHRPV